MKLILERDERQLKISAVLYNGGKKVIDFSRLDSAAVVTTLEILENGENPSDPPRCGIEGGIVKAEFAGLELCAPAVPMKERERISKIRLFRFGEECKAEY